MLFVLTCLIIFAVVSIGSIITRIRDAQCKHEFEEVTSITTSTETAFICKKCGKVKKIKLKYK